MVYYVSQIPRSLSIGSKGIAKNGSNTLEPYQPGDQAVPEQCQRELKRSSQNTHSQTDSGDVSKLIDCKGYSTLHRLLQVTKLVSRLMRLTKERVQQSHGSNVMESHSFTDIDRARTPWLQVAATQESEIPNLAVSVWSLQGFF